MKNENVSKHTPGPWTYDQRNPTILYDAKGQDILTYRHKKPFEVEENARLMVAAPELLEAAKEAIKQISTDWSRCDDESGKECKGLKCSIGEHRAVCILEIAIARAKAGVRS